MKTIETHGTFTEALGDASQEVKAIAEKLRDTIVEMYPQVVEVPWPRQRIVGYGVGPKKMSEHFCYIGVQSAHVNLGFYYGADLPDPEGLLEGSGKKLRHIKVRKLEQIDESGLQKILQLSLQERKAALGQES